jgi:hypothetical protein
MQIAARWVAEWYVNKEHWPTQVDFARFCFREQIALKRLRDENYFGVFDGTIGAPSAETAVTRVKPWVLFDLSLARRSFEVGHTEYMRAIHELLEGPEMMVRLSDQLLPSDTKASVRRLVGEVLVERFGGSRPGEDGAWMAQVTMHALEHPPLTLDELVSRPENYGRLDGTLAVQVGADGRRQPKATLWAFVSSTVEDLARHRKAALDAALTQKVLPLGMELWTADPQVPLQHCLDELSQSDLMILIVGCRYGSLTKEGHSFTEAEYAFARKHGIPVYAFLPVADYTWPNDKVERQNAGKLKRFMARLQEEATVAAYDCVEDLRSKLIQSLASARAKLGAGNVDD